MKDMDNVFEDNSSRGIWFTFGLFFIIPTFFCTKLLYQVPTCDVGFKEPVEAVSFEPVPVMSLMEAVGRLESICISVHKSLCVFLFEEKEYEETLYEMQTGTLQEITLDYLQRPLFKYRPQKNRWEEKTT